MPNILVVEDDAIVNEILCDYLTRAGFVVASVGDGPSAVRSARDQPPDLVVLDRMLPGLDGLEVLRILRASRGDLPIVLLTARSEEEDRVLGLEVGADDYVSKPFSPRELVLRVQSILRRAHVPHHVRSTPIRDGELTLDPLARQVHRGSMEIILTAREFDLLTHFMTHPGRAFSREELLRQVWGWEFGDESTVTVHVRRLREKVEQDPSMPLRIVTVWGVGYRWVSHA